MYHDIQYNWYLIYWMNSYSFSYYRSSDPILSESSWLVWWSQMSTFNIVKEPVQRTLGESLARQDATAVGQGMPLKSNKPNLAARDSRSPFHRKFHPADDTESESFKHRNWEGESPKHNHNVLQPRGASGYTHPNKLGNSRKKGGFDFSHPWNESFQASWRLILVFIGLHWTLDSNDACRPLWYCVILSPLPYSWLASFSRAQYRYSGRYWFLTLFISRFSPRQPHREC